MLLKLHNGTKLGEITNHVSELPDFESRLAYLRQYCTAILFILNRLDKFLSNGDSYWLKGEEFILDFFKSEGIDLNDLEEICVAMEIADYFRDKLAHLQSELIRLEEDLKYYNEINYDPLKYSCVRRDPRIKFNGPQKKLKTVLLEFEQGGFLIKGSCEMNMGHFRCNDSSNAPDWQLITNHVIEWLRSDNKFAVSWQGLIDLDFIDADAEIVMHFVNNRKMPFVNLTKKYRQLDPDNPAYKEVRLVLKKIRNSEEDS